MTEETKLKLDIKAYLRATGWFVFHIRQGKHCYKGISDWIAIKDGIVIFPEIKTAKGVQSPEQIEFQHNIESHGGHYRIIRSLEDAVEMNKFVKRATY